MRGLVPGLIMSFTSNPNTKCGVVLYLILTGIFLYLNLSLLSPESICT